ncbi:HPP family protein [Patulibacter sp. SYSU D01012]|uniref:HPP family protein n=1 Tax=Patulibacter sp. SYSU D01012 TaxID=2817381 RepID=UPI001B30E7FF|nr:HPP family protein [Patulibacter sp. SYSU D01012]
MPPVRDRPRPLRSLTIGAGVFVSALALAAVGMVVGSPLLAAPLLASAALKHADPANPLVAPGRLLGGHLLGGIAGVGAVALLDHGTLAYALAAAVAAGGMHALRILHPPGVATAYVAVQQHAGAWFPLHVVLAGVCVLVATAVVLSPVLHGQRYPLRRRPAARPGGARAGALEVA